VNSISYHRTEDLLAAASDDETIHIFDTAQGLIKGKTLSQKYGCACVTWTHSSYTLLFASNKVRPGGSRLQAIAARRQACIKAASDVYLLHQAALLAMPGLPKGLHPSVHDNKHGSAPTCDGKKPGSRRQLVANHLSPGPPAARHQHPPPSPLAAVTGG
jgi:hypothetical protein